MTPFLLRPHDGPASHIQLIGWSVAFGVVFAALTLDPGYVLGSGAFWQALGGDAAQHEIGWFQYARDSWRFPLFAIGNYNLPEGGSIALSDSIPLFAVPAKLLYRLFYPPGALPPIYTGLWTALCLILQAVMASRLLRALGVLRLVPHLAGLVLLCYMPMLLIRFGGHPALLGQFLILFALDACVRARHTRLSRGYWMTICLAPAFALLVHPYLAAMTCALVLTTIVDQGLLRRIALRGLIVRTCIVATALASVLFVGGYLNFLDSGSNDYGVYSLNLLSPWIPFPETLTGRLLGTQQPTIKGIFQWEGGCYLGAGLLLLFIVAIPAWRDGLAGARKHGPLIVVLTLFTLFAISNRIGLGSHELLNIPLSDSIVRWLSTLRASGRFVWTPVYVLACWLIVTTVRRFGTRQAALVLAVAASLQIADVGPMQIGLREASASAATPTIDGAEWTRLISSHVRLFQYPSFECGGLFGGGVPGTRFRGLEIDWIAARLGKANNSAYLARPTKNCQRELDHAVSHFGEPGVLYLYRSDTETGALLSRHGINSKRCGYLDDVVVCSADMDLSRLE